MKPKFIYSDRFLNAISWFMSVGGISLFPLVILKEKYKNPLNIYNVVRSKTIHNHETIHFQQQLEMFVLFFYLIYVIEFFIKLIIYRKYKTAYKNISFEREAYLNESNFSYLKNRRRYNWINLIFIK